MLDGLVVTLHWDPWGCGLQLQGRKCQIRREWLRAGYYGQVARLEVVAVVRRHSVLVLVPQNLLLCSVALLPKLSCCSVAAAGSIFFDQLFVLLLSC